RAVIAPLPSAIPLHRLRTYVDDRDAARIPVVAESASDTFESASAPTTSATSDLLTCRVAPRIRASGKASSTVPSAIALPLPGASASESCGLHSPQRLRSLAIGRAAFAMLNKAAPAMIPAAVNTAPATMSASDAILIEIEARLKAAHRRRTP